MKTLLIMRHGEALPPHDGTDFNRVLSEKGRRDSGAVGQALDRVYGDRLQCIVHSPLVRTSQTAQLVSEQFGHESLVLQAPALQAGASPQAIFGEVEVQASSPCVLVVGHMPDVASACFYISGGQSALRVSPGTLMVMEFEGTFRMGEGILRGIYAPEEIGNFI